LSGKLSSPVRVCFQMWKLPSSDSGLINSSMARRAIENAISGQPDMTADPNVQARCAHLVEEVKLTLTAIRSLAQKGVEDPLADPATLAKSVEVGIMDAPQLKNNRFAPGLVQTRILDGACLALDPRSGQPISETDRLQMLRKENV